MSSTSSNPAVHARQGKAWSLNEDRQLYDSFVGGQPVDLLASAHERSAGGIRSRLARLGLIGETGGPVTPPPPFVAPARRQSVTPPPAEQDATHPVFAVSTGDGWIVEIKSNRPLSRAMIDRLTAMLRGVVPEDGS